MPSPQHQALRQAAAVVAALEAAGYPVIESVEMQPPALAA